MNISKKSVIDSYIEAKLTKDGKENRSKSIEGSKANMSNRLSELRKLHKLQKGKESMIIGFAEA